MHQHLIPAGPPLATPPVVASTRDPVSVTAREPAAPVENPTGRIRSSSPPTPAIGSSEGGAGATTPRETSWAAAARIVLSPRVRVPRPPAQPGRGSRPGRRVERGDPDRSASSGAASSAALFYANSTTARVLVESGASTPAGTTAEIESGTTQSPLSIPAVVPFVTHDPTAFVAHHESTRLSNATSSFMSLNTLVTPPVRTPPLFLPAPRQASVSAAPPLEEDEASASCSMLGTPARHADAAGAAGSQSSLEQAQTDIGLGAGGRSSTARSRRSRAGRRNSKTQKALRGRAAVDRSFLPIQPFQLFSRDGDDSAGSPRPAAGNNTDLGSGKIVAAHMPSVGFALRVLNSKALTAYEVVNHGADLDTTEVYLAKINFIPILRFKYVAEQFRVSPSRSTSAVVSPTSENTAGIKPFLTLFLTRMVRVTDPPLTGVLAEAASTSDGVVVVTRRGRTAHGYVEAWDEDGARMLESRSCTSSRDTSSCGSRGSSRATRHRVNARPPDEDASSGERPVDAGESPVRPRAPERGPSLQNGIFSHNRLARGRATEIISAGASEDEESSCPSESPARGLPPAEGPVRSRTTLPWGVRSASGGQKGAVMERNLMRVHEFCDFFQLPGRVRTMLVKVVRGFLGTFSFASGPYSFVARLDTDVVGVRAPGTFPAAAPHPHVHLHQDIFLCGTPQYHENCGGQVGALPFRPQTMFEQHRSRLPAEYREQFAEGSHNRKGLNRMLAEMSALGQEVVLHEESELQGMRMAASSSSTASVAVAREDGDRTGFPPQDEERDFEVPAAPAAESRDGPVPASPRPDRIDFGYGKPRPARHSQDKKRCLRIRHTLVSLGATTDFLAEGESCSESAVVDFAAEEAASTDSAGAVEMEPVDVSP